jgi:plasmid stabilization system protein ParE
LKYKLKIEQEALQDIQEITDWYNSQVQGLGSRFQKQAKSQVNSLKTNPHIYSNRYVDVNCMLIKKFPFLVHYTINDDAFLVEIFAVIHTSRNPKIWENRRHL